VAINRALAVAELEGPEAGLAALPDSSADARLVQYQPYWAARAELLARRGAIDDAWRAYDVAIGLERDPAVRAFLEQRRAALGADIETLRRVDSWGGS
jgi:predicted RNA polymerase sigma factor